MLSRLFKVLISLLLVGTTYGASLKNGKVSFQATTNAFDLPSNEIPLSGKPVLKDGKLSGVFSVQIGLFETGNSTRDEHMRKKDVLDIAKFPNAELVLNPTDVKGSSFTGKLTIKGKSNPVKGSFVAYGTNQFKFEFEINMKDFGIKPPSLIAVYMNEKVTILAEGEVI